MIVVGVAAMVVSVFMMYKCGKDFGADFLYEWIYK